jgi:hypothetical protein
MNKIHCDLCGGIIEDTEKSESVRYSKKENFIFEKLYDYGLIGRYWKQIDICKNCFEKLIEGGEENGM